MFFFPFCSLCQASSTKFTDITMNSFLSFLLSFLILSIISFQLTSSASFPNPPQFPPPNASADEWTLFWKLLHNYYAIIARPRFGKRYDSKQSSLLGIINSNPVPLSSENDQQLNIDDFYTFTQPDQRQRRR